MQYDIIVFCFAITGAEQSFTCLRGKKLCPRSQCSFRVYERERISYEGLAVTVIPTCAWAAENLHSVVSILDSCKVWGYTWSWPLARPSQTRLSLKHHQHSERNGIVPEEAVVELNCFNMI